MNAAISFISLKNAISGGINGNSDIVNEDKEEVISRLKFIGCIEKEEKINVRYVTKYPNSIATKIYRTLLYPDNRYNGYKFVRSVIYRTFDIIDKELLQNRLPENLILDLIKAKQGLINLKGTYSDDTKFSCDMDVLIEQVTEKLRKLEALLPKAITSC